MTTAQRKLLEKFAAGDRPLNKAIAAALAEIDGAKAENRELTARRGSFRRLLRNLTRSQEEGRDATELS